MTWLASTLRHEQVQVDMVAGSFNNLLATALPRAGAMIFCA